MGANEPRIILGQTCDLPLVYNDEHSGADGDVSIYRPTPMSEWFIIGDYAQGDYLPPPHPIMVVRVEDEEEDNPILKKPDDYEWVWDDVGSGAYRNGSIWRPKPPDGYVTIGYVANDRNDSTKPDIKNYRCVRSDYARKGKVDTSRIWWDKKSGAKHGDVTLFRILQSDGTPTSFFYAQPNYNDPSGEVYTIATS